MMTSMSVRVSHGLVKSVLNCGKPTGKDWKRQPRKLGRGRRPLLVKCRFLRNIDIRRDVVEFRFNV